MKIADETITAFLVGITIQNQKIISKNDIKFVPEFQCLLEHLVANILSRALQLNFVRSYPLFMPVFCCEFFFYIKKCKIENWIRVKK